MHVIRHHDRYVQFIFLSMIMATTRKVDVPSTRRHYPAKLCHERNEMRCEVFLQMRQISTIELHTGILARLKTSQNQSR